MPANSPARVWKIAIVDGYEYLFEVARHDQPRRGTLRASPLPETKLSLQRNLAVSNRAILPQRRLTLRNTLILLHYARSFDHGTRFAH